MLSPEKNARTLSRRLEVPRALRAFVRARESGLLFLGAGVGAFAGLVVAAMSLAVSELHAVFFGLERTQRLFALDTMDPSRAPIVRCGIRRVRQITPRNFCVPQRFG